MTKETIKFDDFFDVMAAPLEAIGYIEIAFHVEGDDFYNECWMGKGKDNETGKEANWFGLTPDGKNAFDYEDVFSFVNAEVFNGKSLKDIWNKVVIDKIDWCNPEERFQDYIYFRNRWNNKKREHK